MNKKEIKGYSLKDSNNTGTYNIYIWDKRTYNSYDVKEKRKFKRDVKKEEYNNYSKVDKWIKIGRYDDLENRQFYLKQIATHIKNMYEKDVSIEELEEELLQRFNELEEKRKKKLSFIKGKLKYECLKRGITKIPEINNVKAGKYHLKRIMEQIPEKK